MKTRMVIPVIAAILLATTVDEIAAANSSDNQLTVVRHESSDASNNDDRLSSPVLSNSGAPSRRDTERSVTDARLPSQGLAPRFSESSFREFDTQRIVKRTVAVTSLFAGVCLALLWFGRRLQGKGMVHRRSNTTMQVLDTLALAPRCSLQLVRVDNQKFLVARDSGGVRSITPVNTFADELDEVEPLGAPVPSEGLSKASATGLSLENAEFPHWSRHSSTTRRKDPWMGPTLNP